MSLRPVPPGPSRGKDVRYLDIHEGDELDEAQMASENHLVSLSANP